MSLPNSFESTRQPLDPAEEITAAAGEELPAGGGPPSGTALSFHMQTQTQAEWCWAAVSTSVSRFYDSGSAWTQCEVVEAELSKDTCCQDGGTSDCNRPWYLDRALRRTGNLRAANSGTLSYSDLNGEIKDGRPLGCRIRWPDDSGHFVVVHGYTNKTGDGGRTENWVQVADPLFGPSDLTYDVFRTRYRKTGAWSHSYKTKP